MPPAQPDGLVYVLSRNNASPPPPPCPSLCNPCHLRPQPAPSELRSPPWGAQNAAFPFGNVSKTNSTWNILYWFGISRKKKPKAWFLLSPLEPSQNPPTHLLAFRSHPCSSHHTQASTPKSPSSSLSLLSSFLHTFAQTYFIKTSAVKLTLFKGHWVFSSRVQPKLGPRRPDKKPRSV